MERNIKCQLFSIETGVITHEHVKLIRIQSRDNNLLIMEDHIPIIGEINGNIEIVNEKESIRYVGVEGYFMHSHNEFKFVRKES